MRLYSFIVASVTALCRERRRYVTEEVVIESFLFSKKTFFTLLFREWAIFSQVGRLFENKMAIFYRILYQRRR